MRAKKTELNHLTAIVADTTGVALACVQRAPGRLPAVINWDYVPIERPADANKILKRLAKSHKLGRTRCTTVLAPPVYRILLTDAPNVPKNELPQALRWVIKDMISTPVQDISLQVFDFPESSNEKEKQIYVVAAQQHDVAACINNLRDNAVNLEIVDIMEMAQRNLAELLPENTRGTALVTFSDDTCVITLSKNGTLYVTRRTEIDLALWRAQPDAIYERIALEIQRSLDYFNRHFRQGQIEHVYITPSTLDLFGLIQYLGKFFPTPPRLLNLLEIISWTKPPPSALHAPLALVVGAALRNITTENAHAPAN
ncbi:MAG: hypothetical protein AABY83_01155 [Pseudomonadota bacterium]